MSFINYAVFDFSKKRGLLLFMTFVILLLIYGLYSFITSEPKSITSFALGILFEYFHAPIFLITVSIFMYQSDWVIIRRFQHRIACGLFTLFDTVLYALCFSCMLALCIVLFYPSFPFSSTKEIIELLNFFWRYFISLCCLVVVFLFIERLLHHRAFAVLIVIALEFIDGLTISFIKKIIYSYYSPIIILPVLSFILFIACCYLLVHQYRNFYAEED